MSSGLPYVAPWKTDFTQYSVQLYTATQINTNTFGMTIPVGQWWQIIYLSWAYTTSAIGGTRLTFVTMVDDHNTTRFFCFTAAGQAASVASQYVAGPDLISFANTSVPALQQQVTQLPSLLWAPGFQIQVGVSNSAAGDTWSTAPTFSIQTYTEDYQGNLVPQITPTPLIA